MLTLMDPLFGIPGHICSLRFYLSLTPCKCWHEHYLKQEVGHNLKNIIQCIHVIYCSYINNAWKMHCVPIWSRHWRYQRSYIVEGQALQYPNEMGGNNDLQNTRKHTKDRATRISLTLGALYDWLSFCFIKGLSLWC